MQKYKEFFDNLQEANPNKKTLKQQNKLKEQVEGEEQLKTDKTTDPQDSSKEPKEVSYYVDQESSLNQIPTFLERYLKNNNTELEGLIKSEGEFKKLSEDETSEGGFIFAPFEDNFREFAKKATSNQNLEGMYFKIKVPVDTPNLQAFLVKSSSGNGYYFNIKEYNDQNDPSLLNLKLDSSETPFIKEISISAQKYRESQKPISKAVPVSAKVAKQLEADTATKEIINIFKNKFLPTTKYEALAYSLHNSAKLSFVKDKQVDGGFLIGFNFLLPVQKKLAKALNTSIAQTALLAKIYNGGDSSIILDVKDSTSIMSFISAWAANERILPILFDVDLPENAAIIRVLTATQNNDGKTETPADSYNTFTVNQLNATEQVLQKVSTNNIVKNELLYEPIASFFKEGAVPSITVRQSLNDFKGYKESISAIKAFKLQEAEGDTKVSTAAFSLRFTYKPDEVAIPESKDEVSEPGENPEPEDNSNENLESKDEKFNYHQMLIDAKILREDDQNSSNTKQPEGDEEQDAPENNDSKEQKPVETKDEKQDASKSKKAKGGFDDSTPNTLLALQKVRDNVVSYLNNGNETIKDVAKQTYGEDVAKAKKAITDTVKDVIEGSKEIAEDVQDAALYTTVAARNTAGKVQNATQNAVNKAAKKVQDAANYAAVATQNAINNAISKQKNSLEISGDRLLESAFGKVKVDGKVFNLTYISGPDEAIRILNNYTAEIPVFVEKVGEKKTFMNKVLSANQALNNYAQGMTIGQVKQ